MLNDKILNDKRGYYEEKSIIGTTYGNIII